jgi:tape measure domain-containing protein
VSVVANVAINVDSSGAVSKLRQVQQGAQATSQAVGKLNATNDALAASFTKSGKPIQTAANGMRFFTDATGRARKENGQFVTTAEAAAAGLQKQGRAAQRAGASVSNFGGTVRALLGSFALIQSARFVFAKTAELESQSRSLAILAGSAEKAGQIIKELQDLGAVTPFTSTELIDSAKRLQAFGVEADKVVETTRRLADASGATGAELSGLVTAYGQVQAKGRLQGEELLQFQERGIALQEELRKMYGMTGEEFQEALSKGQVSAEAVEVALANLTSTGGKYANGAIAQSDTLQGRLSTLQDGIDGLARGIGESLSPAIKAVLNEAIFAVNAINSLIATGARAKSFGLSNSQRKQILSQAQTEAQQLVEGRRIKDPFERNRQFQELTAQRERDLIESYGYRTGQIQPTATAPQMPAQTPALLGATSGGGGGRAAGGGGGGTGTGTGKGAGKGKDDAARIAEQIRASKLRLTLAQDIFAIEGRLQQAQLEGNEQLVLARNAQKELAQIASQRADIIANKEMPALEKKNVLDKLAIDAATVSGKLGFDLAKIEQDRTKSFDAIIADLNLELALKTATTEQAREQLRLEAGIAKIRGDKSLTDPQKDEIERLKRELAAPKTEGQKINAELGAVEDELKTLVSLSNQVTSAATAIGTAFGNSFKGLISGSMTAKEALASFFQSVADHFLDMAAQIIAKMIQMFILQQALKIFGGALGGGGGFGGASGGGGGFGAGGAGFGGSNAFSSFDAGGATAFGMPSLMAQGGFVTGPTNAIIGEGGESEYVIPASKMQSAMSRYSRGARGEGVIPASGGSEGSNTPSATGGPMAIDVRYSVERINSVEYVTADQFQRGMQQAAMQGAQRGEQQALRQLQQNTAVRGRVGLR